MLGVKGSGILTIGNKEIPFENRVNFNFLMAPQNLIDLQQLSGNPYKSWGLMDLPAVGFTLSSSPIDTTLSGIYNRLGYVSMENFSTVIATPLKTVLRGAGLVTTAGTVRSGGFNMVCTEGAVSGVIPFCNVPRRRVDLRVTGMSSLPFADFWVYHPVKKALYRYAETSNDIYKLDFDIETGVIGSSATLLTSGFTNNGNANSRKIFTDGYNRIWRFTNTARTQIAIFDFTTDTLSTVTLSRAPLTSSPETDSAWDEFNEWVVFGINSTTWDTMKLDGTVDSIPNPRIPQQLNGIRVIKEHYMIEGRNITRPYENNPMAYTSTLTGSSGWVNTYNNKQYRILDSDGWIVTGTFNSAVTPGLLTLDFMKEPEMAMSMLSIPATAVDVDTPFSIQYTFEVIDNR
jgi:hypothetical protein